MNEPSDSGYYWVRMFHMNNEPQIIYLSDWTGVLVVGSRDRYSSYYDVAEWISGPLKMESNSL